VTLDFRPRFLSSTMSKFLNQLRNLRTSTSQQTHPQPSLLLSTFRLSTLGQFIIYHLSFIILFSCGLDVEDPTPPSPPVWIQKSLPEEWPERGIDAHESGGIYIEWHANLNEDIMAYHVYRATWFDSQDSLGDYELLSYLETGSATGTEYIDEEISTRVIYSYKIKSENVSDNLSEFSDSLSYMLLPSTSLSSMTPNGQFDTLDGDRSLAWGHDGYSVEMEDYIITVVSQNNQFIYRSSFQPSNYVGGAESVSIPTDIELSPGKVYLWRVDNGARYINSLETAASESPWATFLYMGE
jgi:hypothetical protein